MKSVSYLLVAGAALTLSLGTTQFAKADSSNTFQFLNANNTDSVNVTFGAVSENVAAGSYEIKIGTADVQGFCTAINLTVDGNQAANAELYTNITDIHALTGASYNKDTSTTAGGHTKLANAQAVAWITTNYLTSTSQTDRANAALAIWNIVDNGTTTIATLGNDFKINDATHLAAAQLIVNDAYQYGDSSYNVSWEDTPKNTATNTYQDFAVINSDPIPEPAFYQMGAFLTGGGLLALRLRKRK